MLRYNSSLLQKYETASDFAKEANVPFDALFETLSSYSKVRLPFCLSQLIPCPPWG